MKIHRKEKTPSHFHIINKMGKISPSFPKWCNINFGQFFTKNSKSRIYESRVFMKYCEASKLVSHLSAKIHHCWWQMSELLYQFLWSLTKNGNSTWFNLPEAAPLIAFSPYLNRLYMRVCAGENTAKTQQNTPDWYHIGRFIFHGCLRHMHNSFVSGNGKPDIFHC